MSSTPPRDPKAEREAIEWLERLDGSCVPRSEVEAFHAWLNGSEVNRRALDAVEPMWRDLRPAAARIYVDAETARADLAESARRIRRGNYTRRAAMAAGAVAAALSLLFVPLPDLGDEPEHVAYTTAALELRAIDLADGSRVELSPLARANVAFSDRERRVELIEGVAYFDVVADAVRPFVVTTPFGAVRVRGTAFVVRIGERAADVVVLRGAVESAPKPGRSVWAMLTRNSSAVLAGANNEIHLSPNSTQIEELDVRSRDQRLAWRERRIALEDVPLREVADEVTRFSGVVFDIPDDRLAQEHVSLFLEGGDIDGFLRLLERNLDVSVERQTDNHIILRRVD